MKKNEFLFLFITVFIDFLSFGLIFPLLPYYLESFGSSSLIIGLVTAIYSLMQFIFSPLWGRLSDKTGRKPIILISLIGTSVSLLLTALSQNIEILFILFKINSLSRTSYSYCCGYCRIYPRTS
jgi:MFS family permease